MAVRRGAPDHHAGIVHQDGGRGPEAIPGRPDRLAPRGLLPHVQVGIHRLLAQLGGHRGTIVIQHIRQHDLGALGRETAGGRCPDAACGACHEGDAAGQAAPAAACHRHSAREYVGGGDPVP
jgi:hypothetical protein